MRSKSQATASLLCSDGSVLPLLYEYIQVNSFYSNPINVLFIKSSRQTCFEAYLYVLFLRRFQIYLYYRWLLFIAVVSIGVSSFACQRLPRRYDGPKIELNYFKWFIYFTNWGYLMIAVQAALALLVVHRFKAQKTYSLRECILFFLQYSSLSEPINKIIK